MTRNTTDLLNPLFLRQDSFAFLVEFVQLAETVETSEQLTLPNVPIYEIGYHNKCFLELTVFNHLRWHSQSGFEYILMLNMIILILP